MKIVGSELVKLSPKELYKGWLFVKPGVLSLGFLEQKLVSHFMLRRTSIYFDKRRPAGWRIIAGRHLRQHQTVGVHSGG
jgi:hypothetical protein